LKLTSKSQEDLIKNNVLCGGGGEKFLEFYDNHFELGKGGFGGVYKGFDKRDNSFVAIKIMPLESG
jgi:hypothetical protein